MKVSILNKQDLPQSLWSGGSTSELYIAPENSSYSDRNFDVRISTAQIETATSDFTNLPGVSRKLMILKGEIEIIHENHYNKVLKPFDIDAFKGEWTTKAIGTCTDFNVMTRGNIQSDLSSFHLDASMNRELTINHLWRTFCLFLAEGSLEIKVDGKSLRLDKGSLIVIDALKERAFPINAITKCVGILTCLG